MKYLLLKLFVTLLIVTLSLGASVTRAQRDEDSPPWIIEKSPLESDLRIEIWESKAVYRAGVTVTNFIHVELNKPAYVYIYNISTVDEIRLLFPNWSSQDSFLGPGEYALPGERFEITGPEGTAYVQAIATKCPIDLALAPEGFQEREPFLLLGTDPISVREDIKRIIQDYSLTDSEWTTDWDQYEVSPPVLPFAGVEESVKLTIEIVDAETSQTPNEAKAFVDGEYRGPVPPQGEELELLPGDYEISAYAPGYQPEIRKIGLKEETTERFELQPAKRAYFEFKPKYPHINKEIEFDASRSIGPSQIILYEWDFDCDEKVDERTASPIILHSFPSRGTYRVTLTVVFENGEWDPSDPQWVEVVGGDYRRIKEEGDAKANIKEEQGVIKVEEIVTAGSAHVNLVAPGLSPLAEIPTELSEVKKVMLYFQVHYDSFPREKVRSPQSFVELAFLGEEGNILGEPLQYHTLDSRGRPRYAGSIDNWASVSSDPISVPAGTIEVQLSVKTSVRENTSGTPIIVSYSNISLKRWE